MSQENVTLEKYAYGGESFGRLEDNRAVFVPYALPGEHVRIRLVEEKKGYARAELLEVLEPSPKRVEPRCPHFRHCGGCHYQHIPYDLQLEAKADILGDQLLRIGKIENPLIQPIVASPSPWNYRNQAQFHLTPEGRLGFQGKRSHQVISIQECHLLESTINDLWPRLDLEPIPGLDRMILREGADGDALLILESSDPEPVELVVDLPLSVVHSGPGGSLVLAGEDHLIIEVASRPFRVSAGAFFQVNTGMAESMVNHILDVLTIPPGTTLVDAYCGVGLFSAFLAPHVDRLIGIETSPSACDDFVTNLDEYGNVELYEAKVDEVLPGLDFKPEMVVVDPPRSGLGRRVMDCILDLAPETLVYISCDPATLSRDARRLIKGGYGLTQITPFDNFPQTFHIETISFWEKA